ncbi:MAG TPA: hypothetical protein VFV37_11245, partial [Luteibaculaceae bacterium]|nr:hypothetical protein [Luteibaculaceae bacterium]
HELNINSVFFVKARPATFCQMASAPVIEAVPEFAKPELLAQGLIKSWAPPAEPARSGLPAKVLVTAETLSRAVNNSLFFLKNMILFN